MSTTRRLFTFCLLYVSFRAYPVKVLVGSEEQTFFVHAALLSKTSKIFAAATKEEWDQSGERVIKLPEETTETFELYVRWLYAGRVVVKRQTDKITRGYEALAKLYALGERLMDATFQNCLMDGFLAGVKERDDDGLTWWPTANHATVIFRSTTSNSPARRFIIDCFVKQAKESWFTRFADKPDTLDPQFLLDLSAALLKHRELPEDKIEDYDHLMRGPSCRYHIHEDGKTCADEELPEAESHGDE